MRNFTGSDREVEVEEKKMLVSATEMLQKAKAGHYAVGQFNINNLEWTKAILFDSTGVQFTGYPRCV